MTSDPDFVPNHYYPGYEIPVSLIKTDDYLTYDFSNAFVKNLPPPENPPWYANHNGYDLVRSALPFQQNGAQLIEFQITGMGKTVEFWLTSGFTGCSMTLLAPNNSETEHARDSNGVVQPWVVYSSTSSSWPYVETDPDFNAPVAGFRHFLTEGVLYVLEIGSASYDNGSRPAYYGSNTSGPADSSIARGYDNTFTLNVNYQKLPSLNDIRDDAYKVTTWSDGSAYISIPILNSGYSQSYSNTGGEGSGTDDPSLPAGHQTLMFTGWWKYQPSISGTAILNWNILPANSNEYWMNVYHQDLSGTGTLVLLKELDYNHRADILDVLAGEEYFFQIGTRSSYNNNRAVAQVYMLNVAGPETSDNVSDGSGKYSHVGDTAVRASDGSGGSGGGGSGGSGGGSGGTGGGSIVIPPGYYIDPTNPEWVVPIPPEVPDQNSNYVRGLGRFPLLDHSLGNKMDVEAKSNLGSRYPNSPF